MKRLTLKHCTLIAFALVLASGRAVAAEFYQNKQLRIVLAGEGGYDLFARMIARHWGRYLGKDMNFIVQYMPGAGGILATNYLYNVAPKDGLTVGLINNTIVFDPLYGNRQALFDSRKFNWLGTPSQEAAVFIVWHSSPIKSMHDKMSRELILGASGVGSTPAFFARVFAKLFDFPVRIIAGYQGQSDALLAMERGEIDGHASPFWSTLQSNYAAWLADKKIRPLVYYGGTRNPEIPAPFALDLLADPDKRAIMELAQAGLAMGRPLLAPPGLDEAKVTQLRESLEAVFADTEFLSDCKKQGLDCSAPLTGKQMSSFVEAIYSKPQTARDRISEIYFQGLGEK